MGRWHSGGRRAHFSGAPNPWVAAAYCNRRSPPACHDTFTCTVNIGWKVRLGGCCKCEAAGFLVTRRAGLVWRGHLRVTAPYLIRGLLLELSANRAAADLEVACASAQPSTTSLETEAFQLDARLQLRPPGGGRPQPRQAGRSLYVSSVPSGVGKRCQVGARVGTDHSRPKSHPDTSAPLRLPSATHQHPCARRLIR
ncbi:hypothetical protein AIOL_001981 [Candidatus Rhodobacter oscarellae]|uniref:Uncharacterized protein n=1 Tax=Candidatus Rhodobacter oscarellae TaxID=1675527 RepID=A0A0J9GTZ5_9RHOB|nr:hypothetical protein AIOL_001981 [Candidatus Rhodobacter lobularis]